jgi:Mn-dependent DtxR family transcriptional regulator
MGALDYRDKIKLLTGQHPVQPQFVARELSTNSMLASAMLSEMSEKGLLKVSSLKVGSSPLYYDPAHPEHLLDYVQSLNEKDRRTVALLQDKGVLRDNALDALTRVSLRNIKDFAKQLDVSIDGNREVFWKFYLLTDEQAAERIKAMLEPPKEAQKQETPPADAKQAKPRKPRQRKPKVSLEQQPLAAAQITQQGSAVSAASPLASPAAMSPALPVAPVTDAVPVTAAAQSPVATPARSETAAATTDDAFLSQLLTFFAGNNITVLEQVVLKKKAEYDFVLQLTSPVGRLHYYAKAKNKAKVGEADLSHAYVQGQIRKLPVLFLAPGVLTKPAQELLKELKGLTVKQV